MRYGVNNMPADQAYRFADPRLDDGPAHAEPRPDNAFAHSPIRTVEPNSLLDRLFAHTPQGFSATFTDEQIAGLNAALVDADTRYHAIDYRTSISFFGIPFYITFLMGRERRSRERLAMEGQTEVHRVALAHVILTLVIALSFLAAGVCVLYLIKSAMGIDLFDGHFALHDMFFK
mgnify:CR=1 FL=1